MKKLKNKTAVIIAAGEIQNYGYYKKYTREADYIVAADGGLHHARKLKIEPDIIVGDLDSICLKNLSIGNSIIETKVYPKEKDKTDTELAVRHAIKHKCNKITIIGALGKRIDHSIANIFLASKLPGAITVVDEFSEVRVVEKSFSIEGKKGDTVSLIPFFSNVRGLKGTGFKYKLNGINLRAGSRGISNELTAQTAQGKIEKGKLIIIKVNKS